MNRSALAVGLGPVGPGAQMADPESPARDRVNSGAIGPAVIGDQPLDRDAIGGVVRDCASQEADGGSRLLV
jgi:hypothetical protein